MPQYLQGFKDSGVKICNNLYENPKVFKKCAVNTIVSKIRKSEITKSIFGID